jgi:hypothetical protein
MKKNTNAERSNHRVRESIEKYLEEVNKTADGEHFATLFYFLLDTWDFDAGIESKIIDITRLMAAMASTQVNNAIADQLGNTFLGDIGHFLADLTKILMYARGSKGCMAALDLAYWEHASEVAEGFPEKVKKEYDLKLR